MRTGRPKLPESLRKCQIGISVFPGDLEKIDEIALKLGMSRSGVASMLIRERLEKWHGIKVAASISREEG